MPRLTGRAAVLVALSLLSAGALAACRPHPRPPSTTTTTSPSTSTTTPPRTERPRAVVEGGTNPLSLFAFGCWTDGICADPPPPELFGNAPDVGEATVLTVTIAAPDITFGARFVPLGTSLGEPGPPGTMTRTGPTTWRLRPPDVPGTYVVSLFGSNAHGDLLYLFRWTVA